MEIVINKCYGGFSLSHEAIFRYCELKGYDLYCYQHDYIPMSKMDYTPVTKEKVLNSTGYNMFSFYDGPNRENYIDDRSIERDDPALIQVVKELEDKANGTHALLKIIDIPDDVNWVIDDYDGIEWVAEVHRTWH